MSLAAHATVSEEPALIILPTGVGKTVVATLSPYVLKSRKALVVVPGKLIRAQVTDAFLHPDRAKSSGVLPKNVAKPRVAVALHRATAESWEEWDRKADVVLGTPSVL